MYGQRQWWNRRAAGRPAGLPGRLFMTGVASFAVASLLCGLAPDPRRGSSAPGCCRASPAPRWWPQVLALITADLPGARAQPRAPGLVRRSPWGWPSSSGQIPRRACCCRRTCSAWAGARSSWSNVPVGRGHADRPPRSWFPQRAPGHRRPRLDPARRGRRPSGVRGPGGWVPLTLGHEEGGAGPAWTWIFPRGLPSRVRAHAGLGAAGSPRRGRWKPLLDLAAVPRTGPSRAGTGVNFALVFFFRQPSCFVLTLLLQAGLGQAARCARGPGGRGPLAPRLHHDVESLGPRMAARFGPWSITIGAGLDVLGTIGPGPSPASVTAAT